MVSTYISDTVGIFQHGEFKTSFLYNFKWNQFLAAQGVRQSPINIIEEEVEKDRWSRVMLLIEIQNMYAQRFCTHICIMEVYHVRCQSLFCSEEIICSISALQQRRNIWAVTLFWLCPYLKYSVFFSGLHSLLLAENISHLLPKIFKFSINIVFRRRRKT